MIKKHKKKKRHHKKKSNIKEIKKEARNIIGSIPPSKIHKDKSKYTRKEKHRKLEKP
jgi:hypothetical protein